MSDDDFFTRGLLIKAAIGTAVALAVTGLGLYALVQGLLQGRPVYLAEAFGPLLLGGIALNVLLRLWLGWFRRRR